MTWNVCLSGEMHADWSEKIISGATISLLRSMRLAQEI